MAYAARCGSLQTVEAALQQPSADVNGWGCQLLSVSFRAQFYLCIT